MRYHVVYEPSDVPVSDDRAHVAGAWVHVWKDDGSLAASGNIIPPEGDHPDCWLGALSVLPEELYDLLEEAARAGARGESDPDGDWIDVDD